MAASSALPCPGSRTMRPNATGSANGISSSMKVSSAQVSAVGFSNGCALLALKKPPPLVPSSLIASWNATGPTAIVCRSPSRVVTAANGCSVSGTPLAISRTANRQPSGSRT